MKAKTILKKQKGTVLYTVVCVLMVLTVFLLGTLALATTASNRAYSNYEKEQTKATARAILDAVSRAIAEDTAGTGIRMKIVKEQDITVKIGDSLVANGYSKNKDGSRAQTAAGEYVVHVTKDGEKSKSYYDPTYDKNNGWRVSNVYTLSVTVGKTKAETTYDASVAALLTKTGSVGGGGGGAFVSMGGTSTIGTKGFITGGTYIGIDLPDKDEAGNPYSYSINEKDTIIQAPLYVNGNATTGSNNAAAVTMTTSGSFIVVKGDFTEGKTDGFFLDYSDFNWGKADSEVTYADIPFFYVEGTMALQPTNNMMKFGNTSQKIPTNVFCGALDTENLIMYGDLYTFDSSKTNTISSGGYGSKLYTWVTGALKVTNGGPDSNTVYGNWYSKGDIVLSGKDKTIEGDLRCEGNVTINGNVTIGGDLVCGGTLTINSGTVQAGSVYAGFIDNKGTLTSTKNEIKAFGASGATLTETFVSAPMTDAEKATADCTWYEFTTPLAVTKVNDNQYQITYAYQKYERVSGVESAVGAPVTVNGEWLNNINPTGEPGDTIVQKMESYLRKQPSLGDDAQKRALQAFDAAKNDKNNRLYRASGTLTKNEYGKDIYPKTYEPGENNKDIIDTLGIMPPKATDYSAYYTNHVDETCKMKDGTELKINGFALPTKTIAEVGLTDNYYHITEDTLVTGKISNNIYIDSSVDGNEIRVVFNNVEMDTNCHIIVNDESQVVLYMMGEVSLNQGGILTKYYWDKITGWPVSTKDTLQNVTPKVDVNQVYESPTDAGYPNVVIQSDPNAKLSLGSGAIVTAMVRAPRLTFVQKKGVPGIEINYKLPSGAVQNYKNAGTKKLADTTITFEEGIGLIGQLIAGDIQMEGDGGWGMIYVTLPEVPDTDPDDDDEAKKKEFVGDSSVLYYDYY